MSASSRFLIALPWLGVLVVGAGGLRPQTGAAWTPDLFIATMRSGKHQGVGRAILPPMPWFSYGQMSDDDLRAMFAYLRTLRPIHTPVPAPIPPASPGGS